MCGIAGYIGSRVLPNDRVEHCLSLMRRRGPDAQTAGEWRSPDGRHVHLLGSRLSIIDLEARSNTPLRVGTKWIVLNGELYNYKEVRAGLEARGVGFATSSDTEVLLAALVADGTDALDRCEGMWAFAVYDETDGSLLLSRDRFGEKPLYLLEDGDDLYFASEPKMLMALSGKKLRPNLAMVRRYLVNGYKSLYKGRETFFEGLSELPAASWMKIRSNGTRHERTYWTPGFDPRSDMTYAEAVEGVRKRLIRAVEIRLRADVPLAFCMSGGIDSNSLISIAKRVFDYDVHGFTIVNEDARYEEQEMVDLAVSELGVRHTSVPVKTDGFLPGLRELVKYHDAPVATITYFAHWHLMKAVSEHGYRISISGTAADEIFTGYYDHHLFYLADIRGDRTAHAEAVENWRRHIKPIVRNVYLADPDRFVKDPQFRDHIYLDADEFATWLHDSRREDFREEAFTAQSILRNRTMNEMFRETTPVILHEDDLNAMYYSVENRSPFLDRPLFEFAQSIPVRHLVRDGMAKAVLRDAMTGILPEAIRVNRRKVGFNAPIHSYLDVHATDVRSEVLAPSPIFDVVRKDRIERLMEKPHVSEAESKFLFYFLSSKMFLEEFA